MKSALDANKDYRNRYCCNDEIPEGQGFEFHEDSQLSCQ